MLGLSAPHRPDGTSPFDSAAADDGLLILHGVGYAKFRPAECLLRTVAYVLNESSPLPAGSRIEVRMNHFGDGE